MIKYRSLKESDVDAFVEDVLVNGKPWTFGPMASPGLLDLRSQ
ncbi:hypothetical protein P3S67_010329 [Capsicum chacoense]